MTDGKDTAVKVKLLISKKNARHYTDNTCPMFAYRPKKNALSAFTASGGEPI